MRTLFALALLLPQVSLASVLGPCGTPQANEPAAAAAPADVAGPALAAHATRLPLPGDKAPNFVLPAVIGDKVENIRLSDYDGKWRVVCFYPADFTFV